MERIKAQLAVYKRAAAIGRAKPEDSRRIKALRTQLAVVNFHYQQQHLTRTGGGGAGENDVTVRGFDFPLTSGDDVERLEVAVRRNPDLRADFIRYLASKNPSQIDVIDCFSLFFADSSMVNYNWNGISSHRFPKRAMKNYSIFTDCFYDAWPALHLNADVLSFKLKRTIEKINNRRNVQHSKRRRKARLSNIVEID